MSNNNSQTIGQIMHDQKRGALRALSVFMAVILYAGVLIYTGVHNFNLLRRTLPADQQIFAVIVLLTLEGAAVFLPIAIHFWLMPGPQRMVGYMLYVANFAIVIANTVLDSALAARGVIPDWLSLYAQYVAPATPIVIGVGIAFIFLLDPSKALHDAAASAQAATIQATAIHMRQLAGGESVNEAVRGAAAFALADIVRASLHAAPDPAPTVTLAADQPAAAQLQPGSRLAAALANAGISEDDALALIAGAQPAAHDDGPKPPARRRQN